MRDGMRADSVAADGSTGSPRVRRAARFMARAGGLLTASLLVGGCSLPPTGGNPAARATRGALRPELHEAAPNRDPDCLALATGDRTARGPDGATARDTAPGCAACACRDGGPLVTRTPRAVDLPGDIGPMPLPAEDELQRLMDGNKRFVEGEVENLVRGPQPPAADGEPRRPTAMVLACSDLEIPPEAAFDAAAGELFVVRVAGHVADEAVVESARFAVEQFDIPLIVVLGHADCGAVRRGIATDEAVEGRRAGLSVPANEARARPAHDAEGREEGEQPQPEEQQQSADAAVQAHVGEVVDHLRDADPALSRLVDDGKLTIVGATYDSANGLVTLQGDQPLPELADTSGE